MSEEENLSAYPAISPSGNQEYEVTDFFASRERELNQLLNALQSTSFLSIVGDFGTGKTSFVREEVIPALKKGHNVRGTRSWKIVDFRPGDRPLEALSNALSVLDVDEEELYGEVDPNLSMKFQETLMSRKYGIIEIIEKYGLIEDENLLLFVDSLDDLIYHGEDDQTEAALFSERLVEVARQNAYPVYIIVTLRIEVISKLASFPRLAEWVNRHQFILGEISDQDLMRVFTEVAQANKVIFSPEYLREVNQYLRYNEITLGSFKHAVIQSILKSKFLQSRTVEYEHLQAIGGLERSVEKQLEEIFDQFPGEDQFYMKRIFQALTGTTKSNDHFQILRTIEEIAYIIDISPDEVIRLVTPFFGINVGILEEYKINGIQQRLENLNFQDSRTEGLNIYSKIIMARREILSEVQLLNEWVQEEFSNKLIYLDLHKSAISKEPPYEGEKFRATQEWYESVRPSRGWADRYGIDYDEVHRFYASGLQKYAEQDYDLRSKEDARQQKAIRNRTIIGAFLAFSVILFVIAGIAYVDADSARTDADEQTKKAVQAEDRVEKATKMIDSLDLRAEEMEVAADSLARLSKAAQENLKLAEVEKQQAEADKQAAEKLKKKVERDYQATQSDLTDAKQLIGRAQDSVAVSKKENEYLDRLQQIARNLDIFNETMKNSSEAEVKDSIAREIKDLYLEFEKSTVAHQQFLDTAATAETFEKETASVKNRLFSTMQRAYTEVSDDAKRLRTKNMVISMAFNRKEKFTLLATNESSIVLEKFEKGKSRLATVGGSELKSELGGVDRIRFNRSGTHFIISHQVIKRSRSDVSWYSRRGNYVGKTNFNSPVTAVFPYRADDFLLATQDGSLWILKSLTNENVDKVSVYDNQSAATPDKLKAVTITTDQKTAYMALEKGGLVQVDIGRATRTSIPVNGSDIAPAQITALKYLESRNLLTIGNREGQLYLCELTDAGLKVRYAFRQAHAININVLETNDSGSILVSGGRDKVVKVWDLQQMANSLRPVKLELGDAVRDVVFLDNETLLAASSTEGLKGSSQGEVTLIILDFNLMGDELDKILSNTQ